MLIQIKNILFLLTIIVGFLYSQKPVEGLRENSPQIWAFKNANIIINPDESLEDGILVIRNGIIESIGKDIMIPDDATIIDAKGKTIYPGFIESWVTISPLTKIDTVQSLHTHWNSKVHARREISNQYVPNKKQLKSLHEKGFTAAHIVSDTSIFRGKSALIQLNNENVVLNPNVAQIIAYEVEGWGSDLYPNSLLGVIALIRQTFYDAKWYLASYSIYFKISLCLPDFTTLKHSKTCFQRMGGGGA